MDFPFVNDLIRNFFVGPSISNVRNPSSNTRYSPNRNRPSLKQSHYASTCEFVETISQQTKAVNADRDNLPQTNSVDIQFIWKPSDPFTH